MRYLILCLLCLYAYGRELDNVYDMIREDKDAWTQTGDYVDFLFARTKGKLKNCFDDHTMDHMNELSEHKDLYLDYLKSVNNTQFICSRNFNILKFDGIKKFKYRTIKELGLVWGRKKHIRCGGRDLSNFILRCIALEYIKK